MKRNILIAGVGGQGGLSLSRIIAIAAVRAGYRARTGETLGMAQRGGSVFSYVRFGEEVLGPLIEDGMADALLGLEPLEAARAQRYVGSQTIAIIDPMPRPTIFHITGKEEYPSIDGLLEVIKKRTDKVYLLRARELAKELGSARSANLVLLAKLLKLDPILEPGHIDEAIGEVLGRKATKAMEIFKGALERV